ncbi:hypothetical protein VQ366_004074 [Salmonella enterica]|nr:hypothetical protein [Salmonella enterica]ECC1240580.1 hypothetical protein [Salmonella enterica subsp. enterica serovar Poona]ECD6953211.1 hypothetical protein [Salmonella enterica subsp. enterica serovar Poona]ECF3858100.1 hypothetical protein [Salmonella enterica subsp. enterica serovar Poona]EDG7553286.1 hypothetical protein [Salmonella enterica subsp. enterica serovar Poona]
MSNKVQVIFTFELVNREEKEIQGGVAILDAVAAHVQVLDDEGGKSGPQHAYAYILKRNAPGIIRFLTDEVKVTAEKCGFEMNTSSVKITETSDNIH